MHLLGKWANPWQNGRLIYHEALRQGLHVTPGVLEMPHETIIRRIDREEPDWVFVTGSRTLPVDVLQKIRSRAKLLLWDADAMCSKRRAIWEKRIKIPDVIVTSVLAVAKEFRSRANRIVWMPQYFDATYYKPSVPGTRRYDIIFLGSLDARRREILRKLGRKYSVMNHSRMFGSAMADCYNQAKIAVGLNHDETHFEYDGSFTTSDRMFKAMGCGIFYLVDRVRNVELLFKPGKHLDMYDGSYEQLEHKIAYWLQHEKERLEIARNGQDEVLRRHTLRTRVKEYWRLMEDTTYDPSFEDGLV